MRLAGHYLTARCGPCRRIQYAAWWESLSLCEQSQVAAPRIGALQHVVRGAVLGHLLRHLRHNLPCQCQQRHPGSESIEAAFVDERSPWGRRVTRQSYPIGMLETCLVSTSSSLCGMLSSKKRGITYAKLARHAKANLQLKRLEQISFEEVMGFSQVQAKQYLTAAGLFGSSDSCYSCWRCKSEMQPTSDKKVLRCSNPKCSMRPRLHRASLAWTPLYAQSILSVLEGTSLLLLPIKFLIGYFGWAVAIAMPSPTTQSIDLHTCLPLS